MKSPSVSCLCLTKNRRYFLRKAVRQWLRTFGSYGLAELVIIDGSKEPNPEFAETLFGGEYHHIPTPDIHPFERPMGAYFNEGVNLCKGDIILVWCDDDWHSPARITRQVSHLVDNEAALTLTSRYFWYSLTDRLASRARTWNDTGPTGMGISFAYWKNTWKNHPFREDVKGGEDGGFLADVIAHGAKVHNSLDESLIVYIRHGTNGSLFTAPELTLEATHEARALLGDDVGFYDEVSELIQVDKLVLPASAPAWAGQTNPLAYPNRRYR